VTPAEEIKAAIERLRFIAPFSDTRGPLAVWEPLAKLLEDSAELHEPKLRGHAGLIPPGCQWCADEDWPCLDMRNALAVARAINAASPQ
jgi:hypothetical protein